MISLNYKLNVADIRKMYFLSAQRTLLIMSVAIVGMGILKVYFFFSHFRNDGSAEVVGVIFFALYIVGVYLWMNYSAKRNFSRDSWLNREYSCTITEDGINLSNNDFNWNLRWDEVHKIRYSRDLILVYIGPNRTLLFPRRLFLDPLQFESFLSFLTGKSRKIAPVSQLKTYVSFFLLLCTFILFLIPSMFVSFSNFSLQDLNEAFYKREYGKAIVIADHLIEIEPNRQYYFFRAYSHYYRNSPQKAKSDILNYLSEDPNEPQANYLLACCLIWEGKYNEACRLNEKAALLGHKESEAFRLRYCKSN